MRERGELENARYPKCGSDWEDEQKPRVCPDERFQPALVFCVGLFSEVAGPWTERKSPTEVGGLASRTQGMNPRCQKWSSNHADSTCAESIFGMQALGPWEKNSTHQRVTLDTPRR
jgi:hypothetical protein